MLRILKDDGKGNLKPIPLSEQQKRVSDPKTNENVGVDPKTGSPAGKKTGGKK